MHTSEKNVIINVIQNPLIFTGGLEGQQAYLDSCTHVLNMDDMPESEEGMSKTYKERVKVGVDENGKAVYKFVEGKSKEAIHQAIFRALRRAEAAQAQPVRKKHIFADYAKEWFDTYKRPALAETTKAKCESALRARLLPYFGKMAVEDITPSDVQMYLNSRSDNAKETQRFDLRILRPMLDSAVEDGIITANPARSKRVALTSKRYREGKALPPEEARRVAKTLPDLRVPERIYAGLMLYLGLRPCEALGLQWGDIDGGRIHVQRNVTYPKSGLPFVGPVKAAMSDRTLTLPGSIAAALEEHRAACNPSSDGEFIFGGAVPISYSKRKSMESRIKKTLELPCRIYDLRHTAITAAYEGTGNAATVAAFAGHSKPNTTLKYYTHARENATEEAGAAVVNTYGA